jgi:polyphosphate kinase 2 (PPK2 family)
MEALPDGLESYRRWYEYSRARDMMLKATDIDYAPWHIVRSGDKRRARKGLTAQGEIAETLEGEVNTTIRASLRGRHFVAERF